MRRYKLRIVKGITRYSWYACWATDGLIQEAVLIGPVEAIPLSLAWEIGIASVKLGLL